MWRPQAGILSEDGERTGSEIAMTGEQFRSRVLTAQVELNTSSPQKSTSLKYEPASKQFRSRVLTAQVLKGHLPRVMYHQVY